MPQKLTLLDLHPEIIQIIFDFVYYHYDHNNPEVNTEVYFGGPFDRASEFPSISQAIPQFSALCTPYLHKWSFESKPIHEFLSYYAFENPGMGWAVETLDLTDQSDDSVGTPEQVQPLLEYARTKGYLPDDFDKTEMSDWVGLALQLLPKIRTLRIREDNMFGELSGISHLLANHATKLRALRHVHLEPQWGEYNFDLAAIISRLLDLPTLESMMLIGFGHDEEMERTLTFTDVEHPEKLRPSGCVYFNFNNSFITRYELSIISARCKPRILEYVLFEEPVMRDREMEEEGNSGFLEGLAASPSLALHLQRLRIRESSSTLRMWAEHPTDLSSFRNLHDISLSIHALVGKDIVANETPVSSLLPRSLTSLDLDVGQSLIEDRMEWRLEGAEFLDQVIDILDNKLERYPDLKTFQVEIPVLVRGDIVRRELGQVGRLAEAFSLARANGVILAGFPMKPEVFRLAADDGSEEQLEVTITEETIEARVAERAVKIVSWTRAYGGVWE